MKVLHLITIGLILILISVKIWAHGDESHIENSINVSNSSSANTVPAKQNININYFGSLLDDLSSYRDFPTLHPLIVHIPVVLIPLSLVFFIIALVAKNPLFLKISVVILSLGILSGFIAAFPLHPHTIGLSQNAMVVLNKHDFFAYASLILGSLSVLIGITHIYLLSKPLKLIYAIMLVLVTASIFITGHYGGKLTYIHGIGVQGKFLESKNIGTSYE